jgi:tetratricopeptide (TPR) repeat protein
MRTSLSFESVRKILCLGVLAVALGGCHKHLTSYLKSAQKTFAEKNYVDTIDALNAGLAYWKESEGTEMEADAYELLGKSYRALRNLDKALDAYQRAAKLSRTHFNVYYDMGSIHLTKGLAEQAERNFREALRVKPDDPLALLGLGNSLYAQHKDDAARAAFQRILDSSPGVKDALESLAAMRRPAHRNFAAGSARQQSAVKNGVRKKPAKRIQRSKR